MIKKLGLDLCRIEATYFDLKVMDNALAHILWETYKSCRNARDKFHEFSDKLSEGKLIDLSQRVVYISHQAALVEHETRMASVALKQQYLKTEAAHDTDFEQYVDEIDSCADEIHIDNPLGDFE